jgi:hypothetical protein
MNEQKAFKKRVMIATITGLLLGIFCWLSGVYVLNLLDNPPFVHILNIVTHRLIMGFVIGISAIKLKWYLHGMLLGLIIGSLFCLFDAFIGMPNWVVYGLLIPTNIAYGFIIELVTTKIFKLPVQKY